MTEPLAGELGGYVAHRVWVDHPPKPQRKKEAPIFTEQKALDRWDALSAKDRERIKAEARDAAAEAMAAFQTRRGR